MDAVPWHNNLTDVAYSIFRPILRWAGLVVIRSVGDYDRCMCKTIKQNVTFKAPPKTIYRLLTDSKAHRAVTGAPASISRKIGGRFSAYSGHLSGINVDLAPTKRVVQAWRTRNFPEGIFSMASFILQPTKSGGTQLTLTHRGVPKELIPQIEAGWRKFYWLKIKEHLEQATPSSASKIESRAKSGALRRRRRP